MHAARGGRARGGGSGTEGSGRGRAAARAAICSAGPRPPPHPRAGGQDGRVATWSASRRAAGNTHESVDSGRAHAAPVTL
eukprot:scaffold1181_cov387-Prasinococcus_capsulatus_cf.AAC.1